MTELRESLLQDLQYIASYVADTDQTPALEPIADAIMARFAIGRPAPVGSPSRLEDYRRRVAQQIASGQSLKNNELDRYLLDDRPAPVVVKELEWGDDGLECWSADTPFGPYMIRKWGHPRIDYGWWPAFDDGAEAEDVDSHEAAKAACQADYTRRILSAVNAVSETHIAELEAEVAHLRRVEVGAVRQADELAAMRGVVEAARVFKAVHPVARPDGWGVSQARANLDAAINRLDALKTEG